MKLPRKFNSWSNIGDGPDEYEVRGSEIVRVKSSDAQDALQIADLVSWQIHPEMVFDVIEITLNDGRQFVWLDKHDDLKRILRQVALEKFKEA